MIDGPITGEQRECINTYDQLMRARMSELPDVAVATRYLRGSREDYRDGWKVWHPGFVVPGSRDLSRFDNNYGCREFCEDSRLPWREARERALEEALAWAGEYYHIDKWARNSMGAYVDARVNERWPLRKRQK